MSAWNFDISAAPRDRQILMRTTRDDKVFVTNWLEPTKHTPAGRFNGFSENAKSLLAWCEIPAFEDNQSDSDAFAAVKGKARLADHTKVEPSLSDRQYLEKIADQALAVLQPKATTSRPRTDEIVAAQSGADAVESVCPALIDDVGGNP